MTIFTRLKGGTAALAALVATSLPAAAHVSLEVSQAAAGETYKAVVRVPHGCDGQPTTGLDVTMPEGFIDVKPMPKPGWTLATDEAPYARTYDLWGRSVSSGVSEVRWSGGSLPDAYYDEFVFRGVIASAPSGQSLVFQVLQRCSRDEVLWADVVFPGSELSGLAHPAPTLTVTSVAGSGASSGGSVPDGVDAAVGGRAGPLGGAVEPGGAWMRQPPPGADVAAGYLTITNDGAQDDVLVGASAPFASRVEVHEMAVVEGMMRMRAVEGGMAVPAGSTVTLAPGGHHLMMMGLSAVPGAGGSVPLTLSFEHAGTVVVPMTVAPMGATQPPAVAADPHAGHGATSQAR